MPTYEYRCPDGHDFEQFTLRISAAAAELPCPSCGKLASRRVSAGGGLLFKGSGFYITDYGKDGKKDQRAAAAKAAGGDGAKAGGDAGAGSAANGGAAGAGASTGAAGAAASATGGTGAPAAKASAAAPSAPKKSGPAS